MYQQLRQDLLARIRRGEFPEGSVLPSENQLCEHYGVSVTTARRAFLELVKEGVVQRKAGVGTMVTSRVRKAQIAFVSIDYVGDAWRNLSSIMGELLGGIGEYAWQHEATVNILGIEDDEASSYLRGLTEERSVDGVLLRAANDIREEHLDILEKAGIPYVVIKRHIPGRKMNYVNSDDVSGAKIATSHLAELGYRRIGFVCAKPQIMLARERLSGYREALTDAGLGLDETLVKQEPYFTRERGYRAVKELLEAPVPPEAIFVASDTMAIGGYEAAQDLGLEIPNDVAFVGYDDIAPVAALQPPLTTVRTSYYDFGCIASQLLLELVDGRETAPQQRIIQPSLIARESAGKRGATIEGRARHGRDRRDRTPGPELAGGSRLHGKVIVNAVSRRALYRATAQACEAQGARVVTHASQGPGIERPTDDLSGHRGAYGDPELTSVAERYGSVDAAIYSFDPELLLGETLESILAYGRSAARQLAQSGPGCLIYAASSKSGGDSGNARGSRVRQAAVKAGLEQLVGALAAERPDETRVNALIFEDERPEDIAGVIAFLASKEASCINGEVLSAHSIKATSLEAARV